MRETPKKNWTEEKREEPDNEIMIRYYYNGEKIREISKAMDINISTVKTKLKRSRERLKEMLHERRDG